MSTHGHSGLQGPQGQFNSILHEKSLQLSPGDAVTDRRGGHSVALRIRRRAVYGVTGETALKTDDAVTQSLVLPFV